MAEGFKRPKKKEEKVDISVAKTRECLDDFEKKISQDSLKKELVKGNDVKQYAADQARKAGETVNGVLEGMGSGPLMDETRMYVNQSVITTGDDGGTTKVVTNDRGEASILITGSYDSGFISSLSSTSSIRTDKL